MFFRRTQVVGLEADLDTSKVVVCLSAYIYIHGRKCVIMYVYDLHKYIRCFYSQAVSYNAKPYPSFSLIHILPNVSHTPPCAGRADYEAGPFTLGNLYNEIAYTEALCLNLIVQKSQTTSWDVENAVNNGIFTISTGCRISSINGIIEVLRHFENCP